MKSIFISLLLSLSAISVSAQDGVDVVINYTGKEYLTRKIHEGFDSVVVRPQELRGSLSSLLRNEDFIVTKGNDTARVVSFRSSTEYSTKDIALTFVLDNSVSMFSTYDSLTKYLDEFVDSMSEGAVYNVITFDHVERRPTFESAGRKSYIGLSGFTESKQEIKTFWHLYDSVRSDFSPLYDGLVSGLRQIRKRRLSGDSLRQEYVIMITDGADNASRSRIGQIGTLLEAMPITVFTLSYNYGDSRKFDWLARKAKGGHFRVPSLSNLLLNLRLLRVAISHSYTVNFKFEPGGAATGPR